MSYSARERYDVRRKPGWLLQVVDLKYTRVEGYWDMEQERWFDVQAFLKQGESR